MKLKRVNHRYEKEYYEEYKDKILHYQREWKKNNKDKINLRRNKRRQEERERKRYVEIARSAKPEDIERNVKLHYEGKELDMSLRKLGPLFRKKILHKYIPIKVLLKKTCRHCKKRFTTYRQNQKCCSTICQKKYYHKRYLKKFHHRHKKRMAKDWAYAIQTRTRDRFREAMRVYKYTGKIRKSGHYLDYKAIIEHLGPCPGNRREWHIDHIIPLCHFDFTKEEEIIKAWQPDNLQWLSAKENMKKGREERKKAM